MTKLASATASTEEDEDEYESDSGEETIALFGAHGATGKHFLKLALDAGYLIRTLVPTADSVELKNEQITVIEGSIEDADKIEQVVIGATYVVCLLGDTLPNRREYPKNCLLNFVKLLYPIMDESCTKIFLYQANSLTVDVGGKAPIFSKVLKKTGRLIGTSASTKDNDNVVKYIVENSNEWFRFIITRPGLVRDGPSKKRLAASRSLPGPIPVTNADLAEFTLGALKEEKLYDTCPYVVGDGF